MSNESFFVPTVESDLVQDWVTMFFFQFACLLYLIFVFQLLVIICWKKLWKPSLKFINMSLSTFIKLMYFFDSDRPYREDTKNQTTPIETTEIEDIKQSLKTITINIWRRKNLKRLQWWFENIIMINHNIIPSQNTRIITNNIKYR